MHVSRDYAPGLQYLLPGAPVDDIFYLLKRDGAVVIRNLISHEDLDQTYEEIKDTLNADLEWDGEFFPSLFCPTTPSSPGSSCLPLTIHQRRLNEPMAS